MSHEGEDRSGVPTIVALYIDQPARQKQLGTRLFAATLARCRERGFTQVRIDVMSKGMQKIVEHLSPEDRAYLDAQDHGDVLGLLG